MSSPGTETTLALREQLDRTERQASARQRQLDFLGEGKLVVRHQHERWDGSGYPDGLAGEQIPLVARAFAVVDVLDALTTDRPTAEAAPFSRARNEIRAHAGSQFDPEVVAALDTIPDARFAALRDGLK